MFHEIRGNQRCTGLLLGVFGLDYCYAYLIIIGAVINTKIISHHNKYDYYNFLLFFITTLTITIIIFFNYSAMILLLFCSDSLSFLLLLSAVVVYFLHPSALFGDAARKYGFA
jgi:hypothetical protein